MSPLWWEVGAGLLILLLLAVCFPFARWVQQRRGLKPESSRKLVHILMGVTALSFPWLFQYKLTVVLIGIVATGMMLYLRLFASRRGQLGDALYRVKRLDSIGELVYPAAVVMCFVIAPSPEYYLTPILVLTFADSLAALVGTEYAKRQLSAHRRESPKSFEGALSFFFAAYLCISAPLLLFSQLEGPVVLMVSLLLAIISALLELVCPFGSDNFVVPAVIVMFLFHLYSYTFGELLWATVFLLLYTAIAVVIYKRVNVTRLGIVYALLGMYLPTLMGGVFWVLAAILQFFSYYILPALNEEERNNPLNYHEVETNLIPGIAILYFGILLHNPRLVFSIYFTYYACITAKNYYFRLTHYHNVGSAKALTRAFWRGVVVQLLPAGLIFYLAYGQFLTPLFWGLAVLVVLAEIVLSAWAERRLRLPRSSLRMGWISSVSSLLLAIALGLVMYWTGGPAL